METPLKVKVDFDNKEAKALLHFISETQAGKYTSQKPESTQITYRRLVIQEHDSTLSVDGHSEEVILFGIS